MINRIDGSVSRLEEWPGTELHESSSAAGYDGKAALWKKGEVSGLDLTAREGTSSSSLVFLLLAVVRLALCLFSHPPLPDFPLSRSKIKHDR